MVARQDPAGEEVGQPRHQTSGGRQLKLPPATLAGQQVTASQQRLEVTDRLDNWSEKKTFIYVCLFLNGDPELAILYAWGNEIENK